MIIHYDSKKTREKGNIATWHNIEEIFINRPANAHLNVFIVTHNFIHAEVALEIDNLEEAENIYEQYLSGFWFKPEFYVVDVQDSSLLDLTQ